MSSGGRRRGTFERQCHCGKAYLGKGSCKDGPRCPRTVLGDGHWHWALPRLEAMQPDELARRYPELDLRKLRSHVNQHRHKHESRMTQRRVWPTRAPRSRSPIRRAISKAASGTQGGCCETDPDEDLELREAQLQVPIAVADEPASKSTSDESLGFEPATASRMPRQPPPQPLSIPQPQAKAMPKRAPKAMPKRSPGLNHNEAAGYWCTDDRPTPPRTWWTSSKGVRRTDPQYSSEDLD